MTSQSRPTIVTSCSGKIVPRLDSPRSCCANMSWPLTLSSTVRTSTLQGQRRKGQWRHLHSPLVRAGEVVESHPRLQNPVVDKRPEAITQSGLVVFVEVLDGAGQEVTQNIKQGDVEQLSLAD